VPARAPVETPGRPPLKVLPATNAAAPHTLAGGAKQPLPLPPRPTTCALRVAERVGTARKERPRTANMQVAVLTSEDGPLSARLAPAAHLQCASAQTHNVHAPKQTQAQNNNDNGGAWRAMLCCGSSSECAKVRPFRLDRAHAPLPQSG
jgi:hypothetical protein